ncbi:hypothetical protein GCM10011345_16430 [Gemmobacter megaterium]|nr:hypothetical protein GCM10011345_16430 [Gemmobacter megaterium]
MAAPAADSNKVAIAYPHACKTTPCLRSDRNILRGAAPDPPLVQHPATAPASPARRQSGQPNRPAIRRAQGPDRGLSTTQCPE